MIYIEIAYFNVHYYIFYVEDFDVIWRCFITWQELGKSGINTAAAGVSSDSGSDSSTTRSGISEGTLTITITITITDSAAQQQATGQTAQEAAEGIERQVRTGDDAGSLAKTWDGQQLLQEQAANAQIVAAFGQQASKAIGDYAQKQMQAAARLQAAAQAENDPQRRAQLQAQDQQLSDAWGDNGTLRLLAHTVVGGLTGGVSGAAEAALGTVAAPAVA